jgi:hypothetical protein
MKFVQRTLLILYRQYSNQLLDEYCNPNAINPNNQESHIIVIKYCFIMTKKKKDEQTKKGDKVPVRRSTRNAAALAQGRQQQNQMVPAVGNQPTARLILMNSQLENGNTTLALTFGVPQEVLRQEINDEMRRRISAEFDRHKLVLDQTATLHNIANNNENKRHGDQIEALDGIRTLGNEMIQNPQPRPNQVASAAQPDEVLSTAQSQPDTTTSSSAQPSGAEALWNNLMDLNRRHLGRETTFFDDYNNLHTRLKEELLLPYPEHGAATPQPQQQQQQVVAMQQPQQQQQQDDDDEEDDDKNKKFSPEELAKHKKDSEE